MSDTSGQNGLLDPDRSVEQGSAESQVPGPASRKRRGLRIALVSLASLVVFLGAVAVGGYVFVNHLAASIQRIPGVAALDYTRQPSLTEEGRVLRQQSLIRAIADKMANEHLLTNPVTMYRVSESLTKMLTVDSNFTNADVMKFITQFRVLNSHSGTFVTAPTYTAAGKTYLNSSLADQLWAAPGNDSLAAFEKNYPSTITPAAPH